MPVKELPLATLQSYLRHNSGSYNNSTFVALTLEFFNKLKVSTAISGREQYEAVAKRSREYSIFVKSNFDPFSAQYFNHEYLIAAMFMA